MKNASELAGKTIRSSEFVRAEYGRTNDWYLCITTTDGDRLILALACCGEPYMPRPSIAEMRTAPGYFTEADIDAEAEQQKEEVRQKEADDLNFKRDLLARLKKELGEA